MMSQKCEKTELEEIADAFKIFDKNGDGFINSDELRQVMESLGERLTAKELNDMMREADADGDGLINYQGERNPPWGAGDRGGAQRAKGEYCCRTTVVPVMVLLPLLSGFLLFYCYTRVIIVVGFIITSFLFINLFFLWSFIEDQ